VKVRRYALVAGGGTGGHLVPALAVARAIVSDKGPQSVELVGSRRGLDAVLLAEHELPATLLPGRGIVRRVDVRALAANATALAGLACALVLALAIVGRRRPAVVVAVGGYASVPTALAAALWRVPVVLVNVDAVPGAANRLVGRLARAAAVAFPDTPLPRAVVTGAPVRAELVAAAHPGPRERTEARRSLGVPAEAFLVGVVGGSLGARRLNEAVLGLAELWAARADVALYHVVGRRDEAWVAATEASRRQDASHLGDASRYVWVPYEHDMARFYRAADVVVGRSGANTVAELTVVGVPAVLVPLPGAPGDHQVANASVLERAGAAVVVPDPQCTATRLAEVLDALAQDPGRLDAMRKAAAGLGRPDATAALVALVHAHARTRS
jgi:undecaprenyldiphospho-muramoylpentapeptide beta-N-acetylglucosaminyltransferase